MRPHWPPFAPLRTPLRTPPKHSQRLSQVANIGDKSDFSSPILHRLIGRYLEVLASDRHAWRVPLITFF
jgi:hypothetical protein